MADKWPLATGLWSDAANWNGGTKPTSGDDVFADGKTVTINENVTVLSIRTTQRTGGTAGGGFTCSASVTITANIIAGSTNCLTCSGIAGVTINVVGNLTASITTSTTQAVNVTGANNVVITGSVAGSAVTGVGTGIGVNNQSTGQVTIVGNVSGGSGGGGNQNDGARNSSTGTIIITGSVTGGNGGSPGVRNSSSGSITVTGTVTGGGSTGGNTANCGIANQSSGSIVVTGDIYGGTGAFGVILTSTGPITVTGNVYGATVNAIYTLSATVIINGNLISASNGMSPLCCSVVLISNSGTITHTYRTNNAGAAGVARSLYTGGVNLNQPAITDVRSGTTYGAASEFTGTLAVPAASLVAAGAAVDNTVGTAAITAATIRAALGMAADNLDTQLAGLASDIDNITVDNAAIAAAVRTELATELARIDIATSTRATLAQVEASTVLAKEATLTEIKGSGWSSSTDTLEKIAEAGGGSSTITVSIPASTAQTIADQATNKLNLIRGTTFSYQFANIGTLTSWTKIYFTVRPIKKSADSQSLIQIVVTNPSDGSDGLKYLNGAATTAAWGSIAVDDTATGDVTVTLTPTATTLLAEQYDVDFDIKVIKSSAIPLIVFGKLDVKPDVTRAIS